MGNVVESAFVVLCILIAFPLIVAMGAGPIYITHYPLIYMQMSWARSHADAPLAQHIFVAVSIFILSILVAYGAYCLYDLPVREWLKKKLFKSAIKREESDTRISSSEREQARPEVKPAAK